MVRGNSNGVTGIRMDLSSKTRKGNFLSVELATFGFARQRKHQQSVVVSILNADRCNVLIQGETGYLFGVKHVCYLMPLYGGGLQLLCCVMHTFNLFVYLSPTASHRGRSQPAIQNLRYQALYSEADCFDTP